MNSMQSVVSFFLGKHFWSLAEKEEKVRKYKETTYTKFWKRDCQTVGAAWKRINTLLADCVTYYE